MSDKIYFDFRKLCDHTDMPHLVDVCWFKYGIDPFKQWQDQDKYNSEDWEDLQYDLEQIGKFEDFVQNFETYEIEKDSADPFHWRHRKNDMDKLMSAFDDL